MRRLPVCLLSAVWLAIALGPSWGNEPPAAVAKRLPVGENLRPSAGSVIRLGTARYLNVGKVFAVAFSPDSKILASASWDGSIRLWEVATGKELRQCAGHAGWIKALAFSPDGQLLASGGQDREVHIWETASGTELRRLKGHQGWIESLVFSPDGKFLASKSQDPLLLLWDAATGRELGRPPAKHSHFSLAFSPDSKLLAYLNESDTISLWELATGKERHHLVQPQRWFHALAFSPDGKTLTAVSHGNRIHFWAVDTGKKQLSVDLKGADATDLVFSPDRRTMASVSLDTTIRIRELRTRQERCQFRPPERAVVCLAFSPDGKRLALGGNDITVMLWDLTGRLGQVRVEPINLLPEELAALWTDLAAVDASRANRAIWKLVAAAPQTVPFLKKHLRPITPPALIPGLAQLVADLDSDRFTARKQAAEGLEKLGETAESALRNVLDKQPALETRRRVEQLLAKIDQAKQVPPPESMRGLRAVEVLEHIDTQEARQLLTALAKGSPDALLTQDAKTALERLARKPDARP